VASIGRVPRADGFVLVIYRDKMLLRIAVPATNLWPVRREMPTKLTPEAMVELIACAGESEDACASIRLATALRRSAPRHRGRPHQSAPGGDR
jgi:hypothetical protein